MGLITQVPFGKPIEDVYSEVQEIPPFLDSGKFGIFCLCTHKKTCKIRSKVPRLGSHCDRFLTRTILQGDLHNVPTGPPQHHPFRGGVQKPHRDLFTHGFVSGRGTVQQARDGCSIGKQYITRYVFVQNFGSVGAR